MSFGRLWPMGKACSCFLVLVDNGDGPAPRARTNRGSAPEFAMPLSRDKQLGLHVGALLSSRHSLLSLEMNDLSIQICALCQRSPLKLEPAFLHFDLLCTLAGDRAYCISEDLVLPLAPDISAYELAARGGVQSACGLHIDFLGTETRLIRVDDFALLLALVYDARRLLQLYSLSIEVVYEGRTAETPRGAMSHTPRF